MARPLRFSITLSAALLLGGAIAAVQVFGQAAPPATGGAAPAKPAGRSLQEIMQDFQQTGAQLMQTLSSPAVLLDKAKREEAAPKVIPALKKMNGYLDELKGLNDPQAKMISEQNGPQLNSMLVMFGDKDARKHLEDQAKGSDKDTAIKANGALMTADWVLAANDEAAQQKIADQAVKLAKDNPNDEYVTGVLASMSQLGASSSKLTSQLQDAAGDMKTQTASTIKEQASADKKLRSMENKPLVIAGVRNDGSQFSTADWKGKVILVDFWATWCGPCRAELPRVKKAYADFHAKGLEVLGVSCDNSGQDLDQFLQQNKDMPWPQLFDAKQPGWHPLAKDYGIMGIPTMFLIDKKGVLRTVTARENFEEMIPKLLAEQG